MRRNGLRALGAGVFAALLAAVAAAQPIGAVRGVERTARGAVIRAEGGAVRVEFVEPGIVRLTASRSGAFPEDTTHAGSNGPYFIPDYRRSLLPVEVRPAGKTWRIEPQAAGACVVEVDAAPFRLRVLRSGAELVTTAGEPALQFGPGRTRGGLVMRDDERFIGLGARRHPLDLRGQAIVLQTSELGQEGEGGGFPVGWVMSSRGYGLFLNNVDPTTRFDFGAAQAGRLDIDAGDGGREGWNFDLYVVAGRTYGELLQGYVRLTGRPVLAEKWFFGNIQSKCCDWRAEDVRYIAARFHELALPLDAMILDLQWREVRPDMWEWTPAFDDTKTEVGKNNLQWSAAFGDVAAMFRALDRQQVKLGLHENTMSTYTDDAEGPGAFLDWSFPDVSAPAVAARLWEMHRPLVRQGADFWWQDQGERMRGLGANGYPIGNLNGSLWAKLVYEGMRREFGQSVPVLSRSGPVGGHRYISPWPGDVPAGLGFAVFDLDYIRNGGLAGYATIGADLGGFYRGSTPDRENEIRRICDMLLVFPVIRTHGAYYKLPWMFSGEAQVTYARYLQLRYRLLPYYYSAAIEAHETGRPILAPLCFDHGEDARTYARDFDFLLGRDLLVAPVTEPGERRAVYLPAGAWRNFWTDERHAGGGLVTLDAPLAGGRSLPMLVREGAILPMVAPRLTTASELFEGFTFHLYPAPGAATERTFKDRARALDESHEFSARLADEAGAVTAAFTGVRRLETLYVHGVAKPAAVTVNGRALPEQAMGAATAGWSHGASDFDLQAGTTVLKIRLPAGNDGPVECVITK